tara:strand:- start:275 stop:481 length:207 start_codon:yes stop_codon:yes gene_type:complete
MKEDKTFVNKDGYAKSVDVNVPDQNVEIDPRSKNTADKAFNYIATGDAVEVRGTKRMLRDKNKTAKWY